MKKLLITLTTAIASISLATLASAGAKNKTTKEDSLAPQVSLDEMKGFVTSKQATFLDANSARTYEEGHIPGALSYSKNEKTLGSVLPAKKDTLIVAYCGGPLCTAWEDAAKAAKELGYTNIKHFKGGLKGWKESGGVLEASK